MAGADSARTRSVDRFLKPPLDLVPDVLEELTWNGFLDVTYNGDIKVQEGNELTPTQVKNEPKVDYSIEPEGWYLLCMIDPDAPIRKDPKNRAILHWLVGNIPGKDVSAGEVLAQYVGSGPPQGSGLHRYVFLVFKQPGKLVFDEPRMTIRTIEPRKWFSIQTFAHKYGLSQPVVNLYQAQYDDYVPVLYKQMGIIVQQT